MPTASYNRTALQNPVSAFPATEAVTFTAADGVHHVAAVDDYVLVDGDSAVIGVMGKAAFEAEYAVVTP